MAFGVFIQPAVPFSSFKAALVITGGKHPAFFLDASFGLGASSSGINPPAQPVTLEVGTYAVTIPAGSFRLLNPGQKLAIYEFNGTISGASLILDITSLGHNSYQFGVAGTPVNLITVPNPVSVSLSIGNNAGSTSVNAKRIPGTAATAGAQ